MPDVNILVYAHREDSRFHEAIKPWLDELVSSGERFALSELVLSSFVRVVTNRGAFDPPTPISEAFRVVAALREAPNAVIISPGPDHWNIFERLCTGLKISGGRVSDVYHAALAIEHDCEFVSVDAGFAAFPGLRWLNPLAS